MTDDRKRGGTGIEADIVTFTVTQTGIVTVTAGGDMVAYDHRDGRRRPCSVELIRVGQGDVQRNRL
jgi:hypothetical protein